MRLLAIMDLGSVCCNYGLRRIEIKVRKLFLLGARVRLWDFFTAWLSRQDVRVAERKDSVAALIVLVEIWWIICGTRLFLSIVSFYRISSNDLRKHRFLLRVGWFLITTFGYTSVIRPLPELLIFDFFLMSLFIKISIQFVRDAQSLGQAPLIFCWLSSCVWSFRNRALVKLIFCQGLSLLLIILYAVLN